MKPSISCLFGLLVLLLCSASGPVAADEEFAAFLRKFTSSTAFQYSRVRFPLQSPIVLLEEDGETERTFPFTREKWPLLDRESLIEEHITEDDGGTYTSRFTVNEPTHKEFVSGYDETEPTLTVTFDLIEGCWYVTDCYTDWFNFDLPISELESTLADIQEANRLFQEEHP